MEFWSSYKFFFDTRYFTLHLCSEQPTNRTRISVPSSQWEAITQSFESAERVSWNKDSKIDVPSEIRRKQAEADKVLDMDLRDTIRAAVMGDEVPTNDVIEKAKQAQLEAYKEIALWRARRYAVDEKTGEAEPWLNEPDVQKAFRLACQENDIGFFKSLGRILGDERAAPRRLPIAAVLMNNWIDGDLPLAIFSDEALADLCTCISGQLETNDTFDKDRISQRRREYGLVTLGSLASLGFNQPIGPVIRQVESTGRKHRVEMDRKSLRFDEFVAKAERDSIARLKRG